MKITKKQQKKFKQLADERSAAHVALENAQDHYHSKLVDILKRERRLWAMVSKDHNLDIQQYSYSVNPKTRIVKKA